MWTVDDGKKRELDALLTRAQTVLMGLLELFGSAATPFFKNSHQIFHDILAIVKRCKEVEKILKSSFFEDEELKELIEDIKDELRKEKTDKLARHVADIYKYRTGVIKECPVALDGASLKESSSLDTVSGGDNVGSGQNNTEKSTEEKVSDDSEAAFYKQILIEIINKLDDPLDVMLFENIIASTKSSRDSRHSAEGMNGDGPSIAEREGAVEVGVGQGGDSGPAGAVGHNKLSQLDMIQPLIKAVCDNSDKKLAAKFEELREKVKLACSDIDKNGDNQNTKQNIAVNQNSECVVSQTSTEKTCEVSSVNPDVAANTPQATNLVAAVQPDEKEEKPAMAASHKTLCIKICKALHVQILHIKQEVDRRWLAFKFKCDENVSPIELLDKMKDKTVDSVDNGNNPLKTNSDPVLLYQNPDSATNSKENESIKELKSLEGLRNSEGEIDDKKVEEMPVKAEVADVTELANGVSEISEEVCIQNKGECVSAF